MMSKVNEILDWQTLLILQQTVIQSVSPAEELHITETMHTDARESAKQQLLAEVLDIINSFKPKGQVPEDGMTKIRGGWYRKGWNDADKIWFGGLTELAKERFK